MPEPRTSDFETSEPIRILFVCLGNICRSPLAEVVVRAEVDRRGLQNTFHIESAGTGDWHVGNGADPRSAATAERYGLDLSRHKAQQITRRNVGDWHWFVAMDHDNRRNLLAMGAPAERVLMMRQFEVDKGAAPEVPDPYYGGPDGFEHAYAMLRENAARLLDYLSENGTENGRPH
ncbi:MAG TPA: low molecular weight protein-tyrosine-phosphatase [Mariprofundaceae bacterium]|nr:low molecular weight protein-tyrosine-phosphatase [Mariprofundaceae bacterium]